MKVFKIAKSNIFYRGSPSPETSVQPRDFPGVFFTDNPDAARTWGQYVVSYGVKTGRIYIPSVNGPNISNKDYKIISDFIMEYGFKPRGIKQEWQDMGAQNRDITTMDGIDDLWNVMSQVLLFPTNEWVTYLRKLGYDGYKNGNDLFLFDPSNAEYIGPVHY
jgi:hypothetical protein